MSFICMGMKNYFHIKGWAVNLVLIQRHGRTRKWSITLGREMQIPNGKPLKALMRVFGKKKKQKRQKQKQKKGSWHVLTKICSFYFRRDFVCRYCGGPLNEDVTCRILAGNKPNTVYWILLLGSVTNETSKLYKRKLWQYNLAMIFFQISVSYRCYVPWRLTRGCGSTATVACTKASLCMLEV